MSLILEGASEELAKMPIPGPHLTPVLVPFTLNLHFNQLPRQA